MAKSNYKNVAKSFRSKIVVKGRTVIDHQLRIRLGIGCNSYVILSHFVDYPDLNFDKILEKTGMETPAVQKMIAGLESKGLLSFNAKRTKVKVTTKFYSKEKVKDQFKQFWDLSKISSDPKTSAWPDSPVQAKKMFEAAVKEDGFDYIMERRDLYVKVLETDAFQYRSMMTAARFLNPKNKEYSADFEKLLPDFDVKKSDGKTLTKEMVKKQYE